MWTSLDVTKGPKSTGRTNHSCDTGGQVIVLGIWIEECRGGGTPVYSGVGLERREHVMELPNVSKCLPDVVLHSAFNCEAEL